MCGTGVGCVHVCDVYVVCVVCMWCVCGCGMYVGEHDQICILAKSLCEVKNSWREWVVDIENLVERVVIDS